MKSRKKLFIGAIVLGLAIAILGIVLATRTSPVPKYTFDEITNHQLENVKYVISNDEAEIDVPALMDNWKSKEFQSATPPSMDLKQSWYSFHDADYNVIFAIREFEELHIVQILMDGQTKTYLIVE